jgi:hypothetical protein
MFAVPVVGAIVVTETYRSHRERHSVRLCAQQHTLSVQSPTLTVYRLHSWLIHRCMVRVYTYTSVFLLGALTNVLVTDILKVSHDRPWSKLPEREIVYGFIS